MGVELKVVVFGNSGSGKSTLAKKLVKSHGLSHLDLDTIAWQPTTPPSRLSLELSRAKIYEFTKNNQTWVIEGCYSDLLSIAMETCTEIYFLNPGIEICLRNCKSRSWEPHKYQSIEEQNKNLPMLLAWVKQYDQRLDEFSLNSHRKLFDSFRGRKNELDEPLKI